MNTDEKCLSPRFLPAAAILGSWLVILLFAGALACAGDDTGQTDSMSCNVLDDCPLGTVCSESGTCVESPCEFCEPDWICMRTPDNPEGTCSAPECYVNADCPDGQSCIENQCGGPFNASQPQDECTGNHDCDDGFICSPGGSCIESSSGNDECTPGAGDCPTGETCDDGQCVPETGGECELTQADCADPTPFFDDDGCACVECLFATDCDSGKSCQGGVCIDDGTGNGNDGPDPNECVPCQPDQPGVCGGATPYCVENCCVECIGSGDCTGSDACIEGFCSDPGACSSASDCPSGFECNNGQCQAPGAGGSCDPQDLDSCPDGQFCDPDSSTCQNLGGGDMGLGCGLCNDDCTCDNGMSCDGFFCQGCTILAGDCASGQFCFPGELLDLGENFCFPNIF